MQTIIMTWTALTVEWSRQSLRDLRGLTRKDQDQVRSAVDTYAATGRGDIKKMQGQTGYRIRVRSRRVLVEILWVDNRLIVVSVPKRGDAY